MECHYLFCLTVHPRLCGPPRLSSLPPDPFSYYMSSSCLSSLVGEMPSSITPCVSNALYCFGISPLSICRSL
jgi:hypothetical protein